MATASKSDAVVVVHFTEPIEGPDPDDGDTFVATRHRVVASAVHPADDETMFIDAEGTVIARWPTEAIDRITWPFGAAPNGNGSTRPRFRSREWIAERRETYPRAYERWEDTEVEQLTEEFHAGRTVPEMAKQHGRGPGAIMQRLIAQELITPDTHPSSIGMIGPPDTLR
jgi:hypothetical protein